MSRALILALLLSAIGSQAVAQAHDHGAPAGAPAEAPAAEEPDLSAAPRPPPPTDDLAEGFYSKAQMMQARAVLRAEHGGGRHARAMIDMLELRPARRGADGYAWEADVRYGGDIDRLVIKTEGEGAIGHGLEAGEAQLLYARAIGPYVDVLAGVRQDVQAGPRRTYLTAGFDGLAPYWIEVKGAAFLSGKGVASARFEAAWDLRLTQRLVLEPRFEATLAASADRRLGQGAGLTDAEMGVRLRYEVTRQFAPYLGLHRERSFGGTADFARAAGERTGDTRLVVGLRSWF